MLVHGAWHGAWCWDHVRRRLDVHGLANIAVDNPSVAHAPSDLAADGDNLTRVLDEVDGPVLLVGHSYGGAVITDAGAHPKVEHLLYLTAFVIDEGESVRENNLAGGEGSRLGEAVRLKGELTEIDPDRAVDFFFHDCEAVIAADAVSKLRPMTDDAMQGIPRQIAWRERPATYVVCTDDRCLPVALQQSNAQRVANSVELPTSHSPFLSRPDELAALIADRAHG